MACSQRTIETFFKSKKSADVNQQSKKVLIQDTKSLSSSAEVVTKVPEIQLVLGQVNKTVTRVNKKKAVKKHVCKSPENKESPALLLLHKKKNLELLQLESSKGLKRSREATTAPCSLELLTPKKNLIDSDCYTKKSGDDLSEIPCPKRRRKDSGASNCAPSTPECTMIEHEERSTGISARKKLDMNKELTNHERTESGTEVILRPCRKLPELRAQLLRMRNAEESLREFRATARAAQQEAMAAAVLVTRAKGGLPDYDHNNLSPSKLSSSLGSPAKARIHSPVRDPLLQGVRSPLKATSPSKLFSPRKAVSPYTKLSSPKQSVPHPQLELFQSLTVEVSLSPKKPLSCSPAKSPGVPAYLRYSHLTHDSGSPQRELPLPHHYRILREVFRAVDTVVSLLHNRQEVATFSKLKPAVQQMLSRTFQERSLGQLARVFPLAYFFRQEKVRSGALSTDTPGTPSTSGYQLTIAANLDYDSETKERSVVTTPKVNLLSKFEDYSDPPCTPVRHSANSLPLTPARTPIRNADNKLFEISTPTFRKMDSLVLVERRKIFHSSLINIVHEHHASFLKSLSPCVEVPDSSRVRQWHPEFALEDLPEIEPVELPQPPQQVQLSSARDALTAARSMFSVNPRMTAALESVAARNSGFADAAAISTDSVRAVDVASKVAVPKADVSSQVQRAAVRSPAVANALKGVSASLLEKIRAREAAAASRAMLRTTEQSRELEQLSRLPEVARIIRHAVLAERRPALLWEDVVKKLKGSHSGMLGHGEIEEHLELLLKEVPDWIVKHKLSSGVFVKIDKNKDINEVIAKLEATLKERT